MKYVYHLLAYNDREWVEPNLRAMKDLFDLVVVSEGACRGYAAPLLSTDGTTEMLDEVAASSGGKVRIVRPDGRHWTKSEQRNSVVPFLDAGDWLFIAGADEFYHLEDVAAALDRARDPKFARIHQWDPVMLNFWKDGRTVFYNVHGPQWLTQMRLVRWFSGDHFPERGHETIRDSKGRDRGWDGAWQCHRAICPGWLQYHYMALRTDPSSVYRKHLFYRLRTGARVADAVAATLHVTAFSRAWHSRQPDLPRLRFSGEHPEHVRSHELVDRLHWQNDLELEDCSGRQPYDIRDLRGYARWWEHGRKIGWRGPIPPAFIDGEVRTL